MYQILRRMDVRFFPQTANFFICLSLVITATNKVFKYNFFAGFPRKSVVDQYFFAVVVGV